MVQEDVRRPYVDYKYYKGDYYGKQIASETDFKRMEKVAEAFVDRGDIRKDRQTPKHS